MNRVLGRRLSVSLAVAGFLALAFCSIASGAQVEQIIDGGFEGTECLSSGPKASFECESFAWFERGEAFVCRMPPCGVGPATGAGFFSFGGSQSAKPEEELQGETAQAVRLPTAPAILKLKVEEREADTFGSLSVNFDRTEVAHLEQRPAGYQELTIDLSSFVGPGPHALQFVSRCYGGVTGSNCSIFNIDDVSIMTGTPDPPPVAPVVNPPIAPVTHKCKKGFRKKRVHGQAKCVRVKKRNRGHAHR